MGKGGIMKKWIWWVIAFIVCALIGWVLEVHAEEDFASKLKDIRQYCKEKGIKIDFSLMTEEERLRNKELEMRIKSLQANIESSKRETINIKSALRDEARLFKLSPEDADLCIAIYLANVAASAPDVKTRFPMGGEPLAFVSHFRMIRWMYDTKKSIIEGKGSGLPIKKIPTSEYKEFVDYYFAFVERRWINYPEFIKEIYPAFMPKEDE